MEFKIGNLKPSVCIDAVFEKRPLSEAVKNVHDLGYSAFEFWCWWEKDLPEVIDLSNQYDMRIAACCTRFVSLVRPELRNQYLSGLEESIQAATTIGCNTLISQVGDFVAGKERSAQHECLVEGLIEAARLLKGTGIKLVIEPLNEKVDHPGYYLVQSNEAFEIIEEVNSPDVQVVFDIYHQQISEGNLITRILGNLGKIGHFHAAGNPGRHELTRGEINYPEIFHAISQAGYQGYVGLEYWPLEEVENGLADVADWFRT